MSAKTASFVVASEGEAIALSVMIAFATATMNDHQRGPVVEISEETIRTMGQMLAFAGMLPNTDVRAFTSEEHQSVIEKVRALFEEFGWTQINNGTVCEHCPCNDDRCCWCGFSKSAQAH